MPRIIKFVAAFGSRETLLLASLAFCFLLALIGQSLGISAAAGAFLIGAVVGDTEESHEITEIIEPVRDMFAALFFVSIGMLIDLSLIKDHIVPALIVSAVFMAGKMVANTAGTFIAGQGGRVPIQVGMGMPQIGEFSLAMMKIGAEHEAIRAFLYQVVAGVTAITSVGYPYIARSADRVGGFLERKTPQFLRSPVTQVSVALQTFRNSLAFDNEFARRTRRASIPIAINFLIIVVLIGTGTFAARFTPQLATPLGISEGIIGNITGLATLVLCIPSAIALWRGLQHLADEATSNIQFRRRFLRIGSPDTLRNVIRDSILVVLVFVIGLWSIPLVLELLSLGSLATPLPLLILAGIGFVAIRILTRMHGQLVATFSETFVGGAELPVQPGVPSAPTHAPAAPLPAQEPDPGRVSRPPESELTPDDAAPVSEEPPSPVSPVEAGMIALSAVSRNRSPYRGRLKARDMVWDIKETTESSGSYRVALTFRETDSPDGDAGEEELYLDQGGNVQFRQVLRWPSNRSRGRPRLALFAVVTVVVILVAGAGVYGFLQWGPQLTIP